MKNFATNLIRKLEENEIAKLKADNDVDYSEMLNFMAKVLNPLEPLPFEVDDADVEYRADGDGNYLQ